MHNTPRLVVVALVIILQDDSVLLVRQNYDDCYWSLPGGMMELGESIDQAAIREVKEETGLDVRLKRVVGLYSKPGEGALAVTFEGEIVGGALRQVTNETSECRYFPLDHLPEPIREHLRERIADFRRDVPFAVFRTQ